MKDARDRRDRARRRKQIEARLYSRGWDYALWLEWLEMGHG